MACNKLLLGFVGTSIVLQLVSTEINSYTPELDYSVMLKYIEQITNSDSRILLAYNMENTINSFLLQSTRPMLLVNLNMSIDAGTISEKYDVFMLIIKHVQDFYYFIDLFTLTEAWNSKGKYFVFFVGTEQIEDIFKISWKNYIINIDIFLWNNEEVYTYFPYKGNNCAENITADLLGKHPVEYLFPNKLPSNFNGCPIKILVDKFEPCTMLDDFSTDDSTKVGFETVLLRNVLLRMNLTPSAIFTNGTLLGTKLPNGEFDGLLRYLGNGERDIILGHLWPKPPFYFEYFSVSYPYFQDYVYWYVPSATRGARWESLYLIFSLTMWLSILIMYIINVLVWVTFTRLISHDDDANEIKSFSWCALETWRSLLQGSYKMPKTAIMKILVITWSVGGFILAAAYQSQLLSILTSPIYNHQIATLQELADSSLPIPYAGYALDIYKNSSLDAERRILAKAQIYSLPAFIDYVTSHVGSVAYVASAARSRYNQMLHNNYIHSDGRSKLYEIRKSELTNYICMYTMRGYPLLERINSKVLLFLENGLFDKWVRDINSMPHVKSNNEQERLGITHLKGIFGLWLVGLLLSTLTFIIEILMSKKQINK